MQKALIIFVRHPELGKVKTRLAASIGDEAALEIYKKLLQHTFNISKAADADKHVFYSEKIIENDLWSGQTFFKSLQANTDLGNRMKIAFENLFQQGYKQICIIGSDCYELSAAIIEDAFQRLDEADLVVGPAKDGGYYLLAMKDGIKDVFQNIEWSTEKVLKQTLDSIQQKGYSYFLLPQLNDVDTIEDVPQEWKDDLAIKG
jgi:uncharacterized protein